MDISHTPVQIVHVYISLIFWLFKPANPALSVW